MQTMRIRYQAVAFVFLALVFGPCVQGAGVMLPATGAIPAPGEQVQDFVGRVGDLLGIKDSNADILPAVEKALNKLDGAPQDSAKAIGDLTDAVLKGPSRSVFLDKMLPAINVGDPISKPYSQPNWKWGSRDRWNTLMKTMGNLAKAMQETDAKRAGEIAKATIYLGVLRDYRDEWVFGSRQFGAKVDMKSLLGFNENDYQAIKKLMADRAALEKYMSNEEFQTVLITDTFVDLPENQISQENIESAAAHLDKAFRTGVPQLAWREDVITQTWTFLGLMKAKGSTKGERTVRTMLEKWKQDYPDKNIERWITQALTKEAPAPKRQIAQFEMGADRRISPKATASAPAEKTEKKP
jgi:hypothetical protein